MKKYVVEMCVAQNVRIGDIEANSLLEAVETAKRMFNEDKDDYISLSEINIDEITFAKELK